MLEGVEGKDRSSSCSDQLQLKIEATEKASSDAFYPSCLQLSLLARGQSGKISVSGRGYNGEPQ